MWALVSGRPTEARDNETGVDPISERAGRVLAAIGSAGKALLGGAALWPAIATAVVLPLAARGRIAEGAAGLLFLVPWVTIGLLGAGILFSARILARAAGDPARIGGERSSLSTFTMGVVALGLFPLWAAAAVPPLAVAVLLPARDYVRAAVWPSYPGYSVAGTLEARLARYAVAPDSTIGVAEAGGRFFSIEQLVSEELEEPTGSTTESSLPPVRFPSLSQARAMGLPPPEHWALRFAMLVDSLESGRPDAHALVVPAAAHPAVDSLVGLARAPAADRLGSRAEAGAQAGRDALTLGRLSGIGWAFAALHARAALHTSEHEWDRAESLLRAAIGAALLRRREARSFLEFRMAGSALRHAVGALAELERRRGRPEFANAIREDWEGIEAARAVAAFPLRSRMDIPDLRYLLQTRSIPLGLRWTIAAEIPVARRYGTVERILFGPRADQDAELLEAVRSNLVVHPGDGPALETLLGLEPVPPRFQYGSRVAAALVRWLYGDDETIRWCASRAGVPA